MSEPTSKPHSVAIVAMGASCMDYVGLSAQHGGKQVIADEIWGINAMGGIIQHDRLFAMDDISDLIRQRRQEGRKVATGMLEWLPQHPGPIYMTRKVPDIPGSVEYPIEDVLNCIGFPYLNNSVAYAVAYAMYLEVGEINLYGCDFTYKHHHAGEAGRGNVEWLLGIAGARGIHVSLSQGTTLMDANEPIENRLYGYHEPIIPEIDADTGRWRVRFPEREDGDGTDAEESENEDDPSITSIAPDKPAPHVLGGD